jgi:hypothetical protein
VPRFCKEDHELRVILIGNTEMLLAAAYKSLQCLWINTDITELLGFRKKSILAGDVNAKHPVWNSKISNPSGLKLLELYVSSNFSFTDVDFHSVSNAPTVYRVHAH